MSTSGATKVWRCFASASFCTILASGCTPGTRDDELARRAAAAAVLPQDPDDEEDPFTEWAGSRWTNARVPYVIDRNGTFRPNVCTAWDPVGPAFTDAQVDAIHEAIEQLEGLTPLNFVEKSADDPPADDEAFILYRNDDGSHADWRGMPKNGKPNCVYIQDVENDPDSDDDEVEQRRLALHETVHALGMAHEQQRPDRNNHLIVNTTCLDWEDKLYKLDPNGLKLTPYDYDSVMQYGSLNDCKEEYEGCQTYTCTGKPFCNSYGADDCPTAGEVDDPERCRLVGDGVCLHPPWLKDISCSPTTTPATSADCRWIFTPMQLSVHDVNALMRMYEQPLGENNPDDALGSAFAVGDFDADGYSDLAVGAPGQNAVFLWKGTAGSKKDSLGRLVAWKVLRASDAGVAVVPFSKGRFGAALTAGDFDDDGTTDLAVGAPAPDTNDSGDTDDGSVFIYTASHISGSARVTLSFDLVVNQAALGLGQGDSNDRFGVALAAGDFDGDGKTDLAIGAPQMRVARSNRVPASSDNTPTKLHITKPIRSGTVVVRLAASKNSGIVLTPTSVQGGTLIEDARFGAALAAGKLNSDARSDLVVGSPERVTVPTRSGAAYLFVGTSTGLVGAQLLRPSDGASDKGFEFGEAVALGDFDGSGTPQLAVGAPKRSYVTKSVNVVEAGAIYLFKFAPSAGFNFGELGKFYQDTPTASNHLGGVLLTMESSCGDAECASGGDGLVAGLPDAQSEKGAVKIFSISLADSTHPTQFNVNLPNAVTAGNRFGEAVAVGNFLPNASEDPGRKELVAGQPGWSEGAGSFYVRNFNDTDDPNHWTFFSQETASPE